MRVTPLYAYDRLIYLGDIKSSVNTETNVLEIILDNVKSRKHIALHQKNGNIVHAPLYTSCDTAISGVIKTNFEDNATQSPFFAKIELIGKIEFYTIGKRGFTFLLSEKDLGQVTKQNESLCFKFENVPKKYESYNGNMIEIKYFLRATLINADGKKIRQEQDFAIHLPTPSPPNTNIFNIQIGVMEAVEVELEYKKIDYDLQECINGRVIVNLAQVEIRKMELYLIKVENYFLGSKSKIREEVLKKVILKEGQPRKGEIVPLKLALGSLDLSPTMRNVENRFSVKYFLTLGLIDSKDRMFFRKVEVTLRRA